MAEYLQHGGYDRHLRQLRAALKRQKEALIEFGDPAFSA